MANMEKMLELPATPTVSIENVLKDPTNEFLQDSYNSYKII